MIDLRDYPELKPWTTLKETSKYKDKDKNEKYMVELEYPAIAFDDVKTNYYNERILPKIPEEEKGQNGEKEETHVPKSNDALFTVNGGLLVFIEFKSGDISRGREQAGIRQKLNDSVFILTDILGCGISYIRENMEYILVYKEEKSSRAEFANLLAPKAKMEMVCKGLYRFKHFIFKDVHTYTPTQFEKYMEEHAIPQT